MRQCCGSLITGSFEKLRYVIFQDRLQNSLSDHLCAPFTLLMLLVCAAASGSAYPQSSASGVPQQASPSNSKASEAESESIQFSGGGYLGVYLGDVNAERARELRLKETRGAVVGRVEEGSPAARVGLRENDVILGFITSLGTHRVQNRAHFHRLLMKSHTGEKVTLEISRDGAEQNVDVILGKGRSSAWNEREKLFSESNASLASAEESRKLAEEALQRGDEKEWRRHLEEEKMFRQEAARSRAAVEKDLREGKITLPSQARRPGYNLNVNRYQIGLTVAPLTDQLADFFSAARGGVLITEVRPGELGERAGLKAGDCIISMDREAVRSASDLNRLIDQKSSGDLEFLIVRDRVEQTIKIRLDQK